MENINGELAIAPQSTSAGATAGNNTIMSVMHSFPALVQRNPAIMITVLVMLVLILIGVIVYWLLRHKKAADANSTVRTANGSLSAPVVRMAQVHHIGKRANQEDSLGVSDVSDTALYASKGFLVVVADGMGGLKGGKEVSSRVVRTMLQGFSDTKTVLAPPEELERLLCLTVNEANAYLTRTIGLQKGGTTLIALLYKDGGFSWISVGDSRIALFRGGKLTDLNKKHNYGAELDEMVLRNQITAQQAQANPHREELTSYIGMGALKYVDRSVRPAPSLPGDKIILMTDGIFNTLSDPEIGQFLSLPTEQIGDTLTRAVLQKNEAYQDNFTAIVLELPQ